MGPRLSVLAGLAAGVIVAFAVLGALIVLWRPTPPAEAGSPFPTLEPPPTATPSASASPGGSGSPIPSGSAGPSGSVAPSGSVDPSVASTLFHIGQPAPSLMVQQVGGGTIDLASLRGKPVWVNFWRTDCPPCIDEFPLMNGFAARYADQGLVVLAIDVREEASAAAAFADGVGSTLPMGVDGDGAAQKAWGAFALPVHYWVDKDGIVRDGALGGIGPDVMARGLQTILPGVTVEP
jgi:thiol-disulfide isomerase/thioredoxin